MALTDCIDESYQSLVHLLGTTNELFDPNLFHNPQDYIISGVLSAAGGQRADLYNAILLAGEHTPEGARLVAIYQSIYGLLPGTGLTIIDSNSLMGRMSQYQDWTDFLCGQVSTFPATLMPIVAGLPQGAAMATVLGTLTFAGILGMTMGDKTATSALCQTDPNDPCAGVFGIFGAILGVFNQVLNAIISGLNMIADWLSVALSTIEQWIQQIIDFITKAISRLLDAILKGLRYGLAKLLGMLNLDPCFSMVLQAIGSAALMAAIPQAAPILDTLPPLVDSLQTPPT